VIGPTRFVVAITFAAVVMACGPASSTPSERESPMPSSEFSLTSTDFADGEPIPAKFSCDGVNVSPALSWSGAPDGTAAFALIVDDPNARGFIHWVLADMTGSATGALPEAVSASPDAPVQGRNDFGAIGYGGPCPPAGSDHRYRFTLIALDRPLGLLGTPSADEVRAAADGHVLAEATLTGTYRRGG
jgi:Raf kinase inhibitor-like YbhB/YbcL family protein